MDVVQSLKKGLYVIRANKRLVLLLWLTNLILALAVALPVLGWLDKLSHTAEADVMLEQFSLRLLVEVGFYDFSALWRLLGRLFFWLVLAASLVNTFMSGGVLTVLANPSQRPFLEHFFAGAGRYLMRFLRLLLGAGFCAMVLLLAINLVLGSLVARLSDTASGLTPLILALMQAAITLLAGTVFLLALHYARIETVIDDKNGMLRAFGRSLVFVFRNFLRTFAVIIFFAAIGGLVYLLYWMVRDALPTTGWLLILLLILVQQAVVIMRSALQLGLLGAEMHLFLVRRPQPETTGTEGTPGTKGTEGTEGTKGTSEATVLP